MTHAEAIRFRRLGQLGLLWPIVAIGILKWTERSWPADSLFWLLLQAVAILSIPAALLVHWYAVRRAVQCSDLDPARRRKLALRSFFLPLGSLFVLLDLTDRHFLESKSALPRNGQHL